MIWCLGHEPTWIDFDFPGITSHSFKFPDPKEPKSSRAILRKPGPSSSRAPQVLEKHQTGVVTWLHLASFVLFKKKQILFQGVLECFLDVCISRALVDTSKMLVHSR